jgi:hypothetical protein
VRDGIIKQGIQVMNPSQSPSARQEESLQELFDGLLQAESRQLWIMLIEESWHATPVALGQAQPGSGIVRLLSRHTGFCPSPKLLR